MYSASITLGPDKCSDAPTLKPIERKDGHPIAGRTSPRAPIRRAGTDVPDGKKSFS